jgi:hypothetical protein
VIALRRGLRISSSKGWLRDPTRAVGLLGDPVLWTDDSLPVIDGVAEGLLDERKTKWERVMLGRKVLGILMGDPTSGPSVVIADIPPKAARTKGDGRRDRLRHIVNTLLPPRLELTIRRLLSHRHMHSHRSDSFRLALGDDPRLSFSFGDRWYRFGDYRVQPANVAYREWHADAGCLELVVDADRRGHAPIEGDLRSSRDVEQIATSLEGAGTYALQFTHHTHDEDAVSGVGSTLLANPPATGFSGSVREDGWATLADGSKVLGIVIGPRKSGPLLLLWRNAAGAVESPAATYSTEVFRLLLEGTCTVGDASYGPGAWRLTDIDVPQGAIVHGPEGSTALVVFADRRGWMPKIEGRPGIEAVPRIEQLAGILAPLLDDTRVKSSL